LGGGGVPLKGETGAVSKGGGRIDLQFRLEVVHKRVGKVHGGVKDNLVTVVYREIKNGGSKRECYQKKRVSSKVEQGKEKPGGVVQKRERSQ